VIVKHPQQVHARPLSLREQDLQRTVVKIQMPKRIGILALIGADLEGFKALLGGLRSWGVSRPWRRRFNNPWAFMNRRRDGYEGMKPKLGFCSATTVRLSAWSW